VSSDLSADALEEAAMPDTLIALLHAGARRLRTEGMPGLTDMYGYTILRM